jgi:hypothetical protein
VLVPKQKIGVIVLSNSGVGDSAASMHYVVTNGLLDLLLGLPPKDWNEHYTKAYQKMAAAVIAQRTDRDKKRQADSKPSKPLDSYTGTFSNPAYGQAIVTLEGNELRLKWGIWTLQLEHHHFDTFLGRRTDAKPRPGTEHTVVFALDADGEVSQLRLFGQEFARVKNGKG